MTSNRADLSETSDFFIALKQDSEWRERFVARLRFGLRNYVRSSAAYQVDFPKGLLAPFVDLEVASTANVLLPLTTREKRPLLNLSVSGPAGGPAAVTARPSIAALETHYLVSLARESKARKLLMPLVDDRLWEAVCLFSPSFFERVFLSRRKKNFNLALAEYLTSGLGFQVSEERVRRLRERTSGAASKLVAALEEPPCALSSSEEMLLAIPEMSPLPASINEIEAIVDRYDKAVHAIYRSGDLQLLKALAEYGRRYELIVEVEVPLLEPSRVRVEEDLPFRFSPLATRFWVSQIFPLGEARSAHFEARVDDSIIEFARRGIRVRDLAGNDGDGWLEGVRESRESVSLYSSEPDRPAYLEISLRLGVAWHVLAAAIGLIGINLVALVFALSIESGDELASRLAVIVVPTTVAATFVLIREQTALATRLQMIPRVILAVTAVALWLVVSVRLIPSENSSGLSHQVRPADTTPSAKEGKRRPGRMNRDGGQDGKKRSKR
ncbi:MAG TPA: hypothetical protein VHP56_05850 [Solirubrobacterales bacterium]|nr:hypothetical protein [Solirubrobacterales bacterium]